MPEVPKDVIRFVPVLLPLILGACSPQVDAFSILQQECQAGQVTDVNGVPVASTSFMLVEDQQITLGGDVFGGHNVVTDKGDGGITVEPNNPNNPVTILPDGRIVVENTGILGVLGGKDKMALSQTLSGKFTKIDVTMNCKNPTQLPPVVRAGIGFSPSRNGSKASPVAYRGFGH